MNYLRIIEVAHACEVKQGQLDECAAALWAMPSDDRSLYLYKRIDELTKEKGKLEVKLRKLIEQ